MELGQKETMGMKLYVRAPFSEACLERLRKRYDEVIYEPWTDTGERYYEDEMLANLLEKKPDALITELDRVTPKVLEGYPGLKLIGDCRGTPVNVDDVACSKAGIPVICTPGRNTQAVAEMVVGLILTYYRKTIPSVQWVKDGKWVPGTTPYYLWMGNELCGKKVGIVGFGRIGQVVAKILDGFDCEVLYYDPFVEVEWPNRRKCGLEELFRESDIITLHLPVLDSTKGLITEELLRMMKPDALFVNAARTSMVDCDALYRVLEEGVIRGAILDVLETEPPTEEDAKIGKLENVLLTPHICGATYEVTNHQSDILTEAIEKILDGEDPGRALYNRDGLAEAGFGPQGA